MFAVPVSEVCRFYVLVGTIWIVLQIGVPFPGPFVEGLPYYLGNLKKGPKGTLI